MLRQKFFYDDLVVVKKKNEKGRRRRRRKGAEQSKSTLLISGRNSLLFVTFLQVHDATVFLFLHSTIPKGGTKDGGEKKTKTKTKEKSTSVENVTKSWKNSFWLLLAFCPRRVKSISELHNWPTRHFHLFSLSFANLETVRDRRVGCICKPLWTSSSFFLVQKIHVRRFADNDATLSRRAKDTFESRRQITKRLARLRYHYRVETCAARRQHDRGHWLCWPLLSIILKCT